jgi:putative hydrolase of HD superfamily
MKLIPRSGWISHNISLQDIESVADHSFTTSLLAMLLADLEAERGVKIDVEKVLRMAILHDLAETLTFDISKEYLEYIGIKGEAMKHEIETTAWEHIVKGIEQPRLSREYAAIQNHYDADASREAKIVHAADSMDILLQVVNYERRGYPHSLLLDLWEEQVRRLKQVDVPSVQLILDLLVKEQRKATELAKVK